MTENIRDTWRTPEWLFDGLQRRYGPFTLDGAASDDNHLCERYVTREQDFFAQDLTEENVFLNPPFSRGNDILQWLRYARTAKSATVVLPARTDTEWFEYVLDKANVVDFIQGRINFDPPPGIEPSSNFERTMIVKFYRPIRRAPIVNSISREALGYNAEKARAGERKRARKGGSKSGPKSSRSTLEPFNCSDPHKEALEACVLSNILSE